MVGLLFQTWPARAYAAEGPVTLGGGTLTALALSPDGACLAAGSTVGLYFFDAQTFGLNGFWPTPYGIQQVIWKSRIFRFSAGTMSLFSHSLAEMSTVWALAEATPRDDGFAGLAETAARQREDASRGSSE